MTNFELYLGTRKLDLFSEQNVELTDVMTDIKDISKIFTPYSTEFTLVATPNINTIFQHYYRTDLVNGIDARVRIDAQILLNGLTWKIGKVKLTSVEMKEGRPYSYRIVFYGETVALKDIVGSDELSDLDWLDNFNTTYNLTNVVNYLGDYRDIVADGVNRLEALCVPFISAEDRLYYDTTDTTSTGTGNLYPSTSLERGVHYKNLKYSLRVDLILRAIEDKYTIANGYSEDLKFSNDFFVSTNADYYDLYMWLHRESGRFKEEAGGLYQTYLNKFPSVSYSGTSTTATSIIQTGIPSQTDGADIQINLRLPSSASTFSLYVEKNGAVFQTYLNQTGSTSYFYNFNTNDGGTFRLRLETSESITINGDSYIRIETTDKFTQEVFDEYEYFTANQVITNLSTFIITKNVPKIKVIDFLAGLIKMFNLVVYYEAGEIVVRKHSEYFSAGTTHNITNFVDKKSYSVEAVSGFNSLEAKFGGSFLQVKKHLELFGKQYGALQYNAPSIVEGTTYKIDIPFERMKYERLYNGNTTTPIGVMYGWGAGSVDADQKPTGAVGSPLLHYTNRVFGTTNVRVYEQGVTSDITSYILACNSLSLFGNQSILLDAEINEYDGELNANSLFAKYYSPYVPNLFDASRRIIKIKAILPLNILLNYKLNDVFIIGNQQFLINSVKTNLKDRVSSLDLITKV